MVNKYYDRTLFVSNISWFTKKIDIINLFSSYGVLLSINYINGKKEKKPGHCYLEFETEDSINIILELKNKLELNNRILKINKYINNNNIKNKDDLTWQQKQLISNVNHEKKIKLLENKLKEKDTQNKLLIIQNKRLKEQLDKYNKFSRNKN